MLTIAQLSDSLDGVWHGNANHAIFSLSSLARATSKDIAYFDNPLLHEVLASTNAGVVLLKAEHLSLCPVNSIVVSNPLNAMTQVSRLLGNIKAEISGIHPTAQIHQSVQLGSQVSVGAYTLIGEGTQLENGTCVGANVTVGSFVTMGKDCQIGSGVVIHPETRIGNNVVINSGCVLGSPPFNYLKEHGVWQQGPAIGGIVLEDGVHIGANTVIDRGSLGDTYLAKGVCIDNLVQIAHDVFIGSNTIIAGCAAVGAYAQIGADCIIGGASCIAAYVRLTDDVVISGMSTVSKSIAKSGIYSSGTLVHEHQRWRRNAARFRRLDDYIVKLGALERKISSDL